MSEVIHSLVLSVIDTSADPRARWAGGPTRRYRKAGGKVAADRFLIVFQFVIVSEAFGHYPFKRNLTGANFHTEADFVRISGCLP